MFDYESLKLIWWLFVGVLLLGFAIMDGHDMGVGTLLPFVGKNDVERRVLINTVGPHWDGNQVWFITAGGAIFAAWPLVYATAFSGFYWAMLAVLWALFFRPVGFDYRSKIDNPTWRKTWDWGLFVGGAVPPLIFGVAFGNLLQGVPFHFDDLMVSTYTGSFWALLNPFALLAGVVSSAMITAQGATYLMIRTENDIYERSRKAALIFAGLALATFALAGLWVGVLEGLRHHQRGRRRRPAQPARQDRGGGGRRLAEELQPVSVGHGDSRAGLRRRPAGAAGGMDAPRPHRLRVLLGHGAGHHRHRGRVHVPLRDALFHRSQFQPHRMGQRVQPSHPVADVLGHGDFPAAHHLVHLVGIQGDVGQGDHGLHSGQRQIRLLKERSMWYFAWILGVTMAALLAVVNAMMCEAKECAAMRKDIEPGNRS